MKGRWATVSLATLLVFLSTGKVGSTIVIKKNMAELAAESERIAYGRIVDVRVEEHAETHLIFTHWTLAVEQTLKGDAQKKLVISEIGGTVGDRTDYIEGAPTYRIGEEVLVFLKKDPFAHWRTYGWNQGRFSLARVDSTQSRIVRLDRGMAHVYDKQIPAEFRTAAGNVDLDDFAAIVADLVRKSAKVAERKEAK